MAASRAASVADSLAASVAASRTASRASDLAAGVMPSISAPVALSSPYRPSHGTHHHQACQLPLDRRLGMDGGLGLTVSKCLPFI